MSLFVNTSGRSDPEWVLSSAGIVERIRDMAKAAGLAVADVTADHSNLPALFHLTTTAEILDIRLGVGEADDVEAAIATALKGAKKTPIKLAEDVPDPGEDADSNIHRAQILPLRINVQPEEVTGEKLAAEKAAADKDKAAADKAAADKAAADKAAAEKKK